MAATMTGAGELTYASFPIDKVETDADGDLIVYGKASDGSIDSDLQMWTPPGWRPPPRRGKRAARTSAYSTTRSGTPPASAWKSKLTLPGPRGSRAWSSSRREEAGGEGRAARLFGRHRPAHHRAGSPGGRIIRRARGDLPGRPAANKRCGIQLVKSGERHPEYVNEVFGAEADIAKALGADVTKGADDDANVDLPEGRRSPSRLRTSPGCTRSSGSSSPRPPARRG